MGNEEVQSLEILDDTTSSIEDNGEITFENLYSFLLSNEDIIITIDADNEEAVRRGLSVVKHNYTKKLRNAGEKPEEKVIKFQIVEKLEETDPPQIRLQIWLTKRSSVQIHRMVVSDKGL